MKERPILMSAPMVRAILEGRNTQTRRIFKAKCDCEEGFSENCAMSPEGWQIEGHSGLWSCDCCGPNNPIRCPYGAPGDRLWVRETWKPIFEDDTGFAGIAFRAGGMPEDDSRAGRFLDGTDRWRPSIFMPRKASRITLQIEAVRVERLQDISEADAVAEGCSPVDGALGTDYIDHYCSSFGKEPPWPIRRYERLWRSINGPGSWDANLWVWVIQFRRIKP